MSWLKTAQALPLNGQKKIMHCGSSPSLSIQNTLKGWRAYCHRCGHTEWESRSSLLTLAEISASQIDRTASPKMPLDWTAALEADSPTCLLWMTWLAQAGITQSLRDAYSLGWTKKYAKGLIPVYIQTSSIVGTQPSATQRVLESLIWRKIDPYQAGPKYTIQTTNPQASVFLSISSRVQDIPHRICDIVVTEDSLSAMRVGEFVPTGSILGTSLGQGKMERILRHSGLSAPRVGIWLDPDKAGDVGTAKLKSTLELMGVKTVILSSPRDPKNLSDTEIVRRLTGDRYHLVADYEAPQ